MNIKSVLILVCAVAAVILVNRPTFDELSSRQALYCEMTKAFKQTKGQHGWPDYRGNAAEVCK